MSYRLIGYSGAVWEGTAVHPELWDLLVRRDLLIEMQCGQPPYRVVLGVPHHAAPGVDRIAELWHNPRTGKNGRAADETTGLFGLALFTALDGQDSSCKLVIAAHPSDHDPNKTPGSPYWRSVFAAPLPGLLLELHGAASARRHDLELSAGRNRLAGPLDFGRRLAPFLDPAWRLAVQARPGQADALIFHDHHSREGSPGRLQNPALETDSLEYAGQAGLPALHLEMKSVFRQPDPNFPGSPRPSPAAWQLARALARLLA